MNDVIVIELTATTINGVNKNYNHIYFLRLVISSHTVYSYCRLTLYHLYFGYLCSTISNISYLFMIDLAQNSINLYAKIMSL